MSGKFDNLGRIYDPAKVYDEFCCEIVLPCHTGESSYDNL